MRFQNIFKQKCTEMDKKIAITCYTELKNIEEISYRDLLYSVDSLIFNLTNIGMKCGMRIIIIPEYNIDTYIYTIALACMGITIVALDKDTPMQLLEKEITELKPAAIIASKKVYDIKFIDISISVIELKSDLIQWIRKIDNYNIYCEYHDIIAILFSSGTTSEPKGVMIGYEQEMTALNYLYKVVGKSDIKYLMVFPLSHISGYTDYLALIMNGGSMGILENCTSSQFSYGFEIYKPTVFGMIPKVWETIQNKIQDDIKSKGKIKSIFVKNMILLCGQVRNLTGINISKIFFKSINKKVFGGNLEQIHMGGGKSNSEVVSFFWNLGYDCFDFYASTEANIPICVTQGNKRMTSVGNIETNPNVVIRVWNPDDKGVGEIQVKSKTMMIGYLNNSELTDQSFSDGFFKTGDYGKIIDKQLYITGRIKESIHLRNGEKISAEEVKKLYDKVADIDSEYTIIGITQDGYDDICVFIVGKKGEFDNSFKIINQKVPINYRYKELVYVDNLPKTLLGKIKQYELKSQYEFLKNSCLEQKCIINNNEEEKILNIIKKYINVDVEVSDLIDNFDSLNLFEMSIELESKFGVNIQETITPYCTIQDVIECILKNKNISYKDYDYTKYPLKRKKYDLFLFEKFKKWTEFNYKFEVLGINNINENEQYIFAPNHESYLDAMWVYSCMPQYQKLKICTMAADKLFEKNIFRYGIRIMGAVPVHRAGNTIIAMNRINDLIEQKYNVIIHPEGTRSRNGEMGELKKGAAELSIKTGVKIIPVGIYGEWNIYPPNKSLPRMRLIKKQRNPLYIYFGKPMSPSDYDSADDMTTELEKQIKNLLLKCNNADKE